MEHSIFINVYGVILEIPLNTMPAVIYDLLEDAECPIHSGLPEATRSGDAYQIGYTLSDYERGRLIDETRSDSNFWQVIFFFDSIAYWQPEDS